MTSRSASESSCSPRVVDPFRSEKTIVTVFRVSGASRAAPSVGPQNPQSRNRGGFSSPQLGQICIQDSVGLLSADYYTRSRQSLTPAGVTSYSGSARAGSRLLQSGGRSWEDGRAGREGQCQ